jgi:hypothetical protein
MSTINIGNSSTPATPEQLAQLRAGLGFGIGASYGLGLSAGYGVFSGNKSNVANVTIQNKVQAPAPFSAIRLVYRNHSSADVTLQWARIATSTNAGGSGSTLAWRDVTFGGSAGPITLPAFEGALFDERWTFVVSDLLPVAPADANNYLFTRSYFPGATGASDAGASADVSAWRTASGLHYGTDTAAGEIANTAGVNGASADIAPHGIIFSYQQPVVAVTCFGGSHLRGNMTTGNAWGFVFRACRGKTIATGGVPVYSPMMNARGGQGNVAASQNIERFANAGMRADIAVILGYSGNDTDYTEQGFVIARGYLARSLDALRRNNTRPIVCTAPPGEAVYAGAGDDARRQANNDWIRDLRYHGISVVVLDALYRDPGQPNRILPAYDSGDGVHCNDAGQALSRDALMELLP